MLCALFVELVRDGFNETVYMAEQAGIDIDLRLMDRALQLSAHGFSHKGLHCARACEPPRSAPAYPLCG